MVFFSIVENSFKHGVSDQKGVSEIDISVAVNNEKVILSVTNPVSKKTGLDDLGASDGIGLENTMRQLEIVYDSRYKLNSTIKNNRYNCVLEIPANYKWVK